MDTVQDPCAVLEHALGQGALGQTRTYVVLGDGGTGKTHLLGQAVEQAKKLGWICLNTTAHAYEHDIPYATLRNLVSSAANAPLPPVVHTAGSQLLAALDALALSTDEAEAHRAQSSALNLFGIMLRSIIRTAPVLVLVDDVHLADEPSLVALCLASRQVANGLLTLGAARTREFTTQPHLTRTLGSLAEAGQGQILQLQPTTGPALAALVKSLINAAPEARLCGYLSERTRGNALLVRETLNALQAAGAVTCHNGQAFLVDDVPPMFTRREALLHKVFTAENGEMELAKLICVFGRVDLDYLPLLAQLLGCPEAQVQDSFDALVKSGALCETDWGFFEFSHPLIGELLYEELGPAQRKQLHASIAAQLEGSAADLRITAQERTRHQIEGARRGDEAAIATVLDTADQAMKTTPLAAARWYEKALSLMALGQAQRGWIRARQTSALWKAARPAEAIASGEMALRNLPSGPEFDRTLITMVNCHNAMGQLQEADDLLAAWLPSARDQSVMAAQRAAMLARLGGGPKAQEFLAQAWGSVAAAAKAQQVIAYTYLGHAEYTIGSAAGVQQAYEQLEALGGEAAELSSGARASALESAAHLAALAGDIPTALRLGKQAGAGRGDAGFADLGGQAGLAQALCQYATGDWSRAQDAMSREAAQLEYSDLQSNLSRLRLIQVQLAMARADFREAAELLELAQPEPSRPSDHAMWQAVSLQLQVLMGKAQPAAEELRKLLRQARQASWNEAISLALTGLMEASLAAKDSHTAKDYVVMLAQHAQHTGLPRDAHASALYSALAGVDASSAQQLLAQYRAHGLDFLVAQLHYALAVAGVDTATGLPAAWQGFEQVQATLWTKRVEAAARAAGVLVERRSGPAAPKSFNDVELQLVRLLAEGMSNRQIAEALSYSAKTIESYLTKLYKKSGYPSRVELIVAYERGDLKAYAAG